MLRGLPASILLHGAVVFGGAVAWPYIAPEREIEDIIPVTLEIQLDMTTNFAPIIRREPVPEPEEPEEPEEEPVEDEIVEEDSDEVEVGEDELETTDVRELEQESVPEDNIEETEDVAEEPPEEKEEPQEEPDILADITGDASKLFSEVKQTKREPVKPKEKKILVDESKVREPRKGVGDPSKETARVQAIIAAQMRVCWDDVIDLPNPERLNVEIRISLQEDGSLERDAELVRPARIPVGDRPMRVAVERALRAARKCAPYRVPKDALASYDEWKDIRFRIGPGFGQ